MRAILSAIAVLVLAAPALAQSRLPAEGFADLNDRLSPAVVNIATSQRVQGVEDLPRFPPGSPMERLNEGLGEGGAQITSLGSGFIISPDGVVVTNNHVIESADAIEVILQNGQRLEATVVGRDPATDIAVLRVHARAPLPYVEMGDSDTARVGDIVMAIGNPFGLGGSLSVGVVSARNRSEVGQVLVPDRPIGEPTVAAVARQVGDQGKGAQHRLRVAAVRQAVAEKHDAAEVGRSRQGCSQGRHTQAEGGDAAAQVEVPHEGLPCRPVQGPDSTISGPACVCG